MITVLCALNAVSLILLAAREDRDGSRFVMIVYMALASVFIMAAIARGF